MTVIIIRALILYVLLILMMKLMGKRQIGEMQVSELITTLLLSELAVFPLTDSDIPILHGIIPLLIISSLEVVISFTSQKCKWLFLFLNGNPLTLYQNGKFDLKALTRARVTVEDVTAQVRINGFKDMDEVETVILERTGKMSVLPKGDPMPNQSGG